MPTSSRPWKSPRLPHENHRRWRTLLKRVEIKGLDVDSVLVRAVFSRNGRGWTFGEAGLIYTTQDDGKTWTQLRSPTRHLLLGGIFVDNDRGWLVGAGATIIQTSDGGETVQINVSAS